MSNSPVYTTGRRLGKGGFGQVFLGTRSQKSRSAKDNKPVEVGPSQPCDVPCGGCALHAPAHLQLQPAPARNAAASAAPGYQPPRPVARCAAMGPCTRLPTGVNPPCRLPSSLSTTLARAAPPMARPTSGPSTSEAGNWCPWLGLPRTLRPSCCCLRVLAPLAAHRTETFARGWLLQRPPSLRPALRGTTGRPCPAQTLIFTWRVRLPCSAIGEVYGVPKVHYKGQQGEFYVMIMGG